MASLKDLIVHGTSKFISNVFGNIIHANKFVTNGGTSSQFVKGDGTLDDSTYLTSATTPQYTITKLTTAETGYIASYELKKDGTKVGDTINIPKDYLVKSGTIETVTTANVPYQGAVVGDKYLDFVVNTYDTSSGSGTTSHIYIPVNDLVDVYTEGNGIDISNSNIVSIKIDPTTTNSNGLETTSAGLKLNIATQSSAGALSAADKIKLDGISAGAEVNVIETVKVSGTALQVTNKAVNIETETTYDPTTNKIATISDVENAVPSIPNYKIEELATPTSGFRSSYLLEKDGSAISDSDTIDIPNEFTPLVSKEYTGTDFYAASGTWNNSSRYFMSVRPDALKEYWYVKYRVRVWIPSDTTEKRFTDSIIEYFGSGISMKGYRIWNTINTGYASYYQVAYWLTDDGYNNQNPTDLFGHVLGTSILYGTNYTTSSWYRHVRVDLLAYEGCEVNMFDNLVKWSEYKTSTGATNVATGVEHPDYSTTDPSTYNATSQGLQETGDATDTSNMYLPYARFTAGAYGMMNRSLIMQDGQGKWQSFTTSSGTSATKTKNPSGFRLGSNIYYLSSTTNYAADAILGTSLVRAFVSLIDFRYSLNVTTTAGGANNLLPYKPIYIVGTLGNDGLFYLDDVWWTQDEPSTENGKIYIKVSPIVYNDYTNDRCYRGDLFSYGYSYWYKNGRFQRYYDVDWKANDEDVVHKTGAETITGEKTFEANVNLTEGATLNMVYDSQTPDGVYLQATEPNGIKAVSFSGISDDGMVQIKNVYVPTEDTDAATKYYVDEEILDIDEYRVYLACKFGPYGVHQKSLCAFCLTNGGREMMMTSFTQKSGIVPKEVITDLVFPIGCKIYYNDGIYDSSPNLSGMANRYYTSFNGVDVRYSAITGTNISLGNYPTETQSTVYLHVIVENGYWRPYYKEGATNEIIVDSFHMQSGNFYIYLGKTVRNTGYMIQLEDNNPLYYYDGTKLIDWASFQADTNYSSIQQDLSNYYTKSETYSQDEVDALLNGVSNFEYIVIQPPATLPTASSSTMGKMYIYNGHRWVTVENNGSYSWVDLGSYDIDLSDYVTNEDFEEALENRPIFQLVTETQMQNMLDNETWVEGVIYYTVED